MLDSYASALVNVAKEEPDGLGCIFEEDARVGRFRMSEDERIKDYEQEKLLLISTVEDLLRHEIALREQASEGPYLVFPSQFTRENPDTPDIHGKSVIFTFDGPILNIYSTLAVRISHSGFFFKESMWKNAALYKTRTMGRCGIILRQIEEGKGELILFFDESASEETLFLFEEFVETHLLRRALPQSLVRRRIYVCKICETPLTELQVQRRRERGFMWITCSVCGENVSLLDKEERISSDQFSMLTNMDRSADAKREREVAVTVLQGESAIKTEESDRKHITELINAKRRRASILEIQQAKRGLDTPPHIILEIQSLYQEIIDLETDLRKIVI